MAAELDLRPTKRRMPFADAAGETTLQMVDAYWQELRRKASVPLRQDLAPAMLDAALPHCFIAQRMAPGVARLRVAGQSLRSLIKVDARGMPLSAFLEPTAREALMPLVEAAFTDPAIVEVDLVGRRSLGRPKMGARLLLLPLRDAYDDTSRLFGALVTHGICGLRPRRFVMAPDPIVRFEKATRAKRVIRVVATADPVPESAPQITPPEAPYPGLRLVVNND